MDQSNKLLKILRKKREKCTYPVIGGRKIFNHLLYNELEQEALKIQMKIGLENEKAIAKELGLPDKLHYAIRRRLIRFATSS